MEVRRPLGTFCMLEMAMQKGVWIVWLETSCRLDKNSQWIAITVAKINRGCNLCAAIWVISCISFSASSTLFGKNLEVTRNMSPENTNSENSACLRDVFFLFFFGWFLHYFPQGTWRVSCPLCWHVVVVLLRWNWATNPTICLVDT